MLKDISNFCERFPFWRPLRLCGSNLLLCSLKNSTSQLIGIKKGASVPSQSCQIEALAFAKVASFKDFSVVPHGTKVEQQRAIRIAEQLQGRSCV
jgi:hypothetical protein